MTLLARIRSAGIGITLDGAELVVDADRLSDRQIEFLRSHKAELVAELRAPLRPIIEYRFREDPPDVWHTMLGRPGESFEDTSAACRRQFGGVATRPRDSPPSGFPFQANKAEGP